MKKIFYSLFALSTLLFTATSCSEDRGTTTEVEDSNEDESVNPDHIRGYGDAEPGGTPPADPVPGQMYGFDRDKLNDQVRADLGVDEDVAAEMVRVYYDRDRQLSEMELLYPVDAVEKGNEEEADAADARQQLSPAEMEAERKRIDDETDKKVQGILTPEQYKLYQQNREKYNNPTLNGDAPEDAASGSEN